MSPEMTGLSPCSRMTLRHWPSACTWLCTVRIVVERRARDRHQGEADPQEVLGDDVQPGVGQEVVDVGHPAGDRVVDRDHRQVGVAVLHRREHVLERRARPAPPSRGSAACTPGGSWRRVRPGRRCVGSRRHGPTRGVAHVRVRCCPSARPAASLGQRDSGTVPRLERGDRRRRRARRRPARARAGAWWRCAVRRRASGTGVDALPEDVHGLRQEVAALRAEGGGRAAAPRGGAVRRVRRHGRPPVVVARAARRRRSRRRADLDPRPQRGAHLRQEHHRLDLRAAALAPGGRASRTPSSTRARDGR